MPVQTQLQTRRGTAASWTSTNPTLAAGEFGYETDTGKFKIGNGSTAWASLAYTAAATAVTYLYNATSGQTTFSGADANGLTLAYTVGAEQVYLNGVLQVRGSDYTGTNGTSIVLASGALTSDVLNVIAYSAMTVTDTYTQAQADAKFVQQTNNFFAGKNKIINGDFGINQRNFTSNTVAATFNYDRWLQNNGGGSGTLTVTPQTFTPGTAPVAGYEGTNFVQCVTASGASTNTYAIYFQRVEDVRTFAGQTATVSFWAKANTGTPKVAFEVEQVFGTGGSPSANTATSAGAVTISTSWARYSLTVAIPSISGKTIGTNNNSNLSANIWLSAGSDFASRASSIGLQNNTFQIWGVQLEAGSIATPFQTATGTIAGELAACQRYYQRFTTADAYSILGVGGSQSTTQAKIVCPLPVTMRTKPASIDYSTLGLAEGGAAIIALTALALEYHTNQQGALLATVASGLTANRPMYLFTNNSATAFLGFSAEL
jgi:hypothetical protein